MHQSTHKSQNQSKSYEKRLNTRDDVNSPSQSKHILAVDLMTTEICLCNRSLRTESIPSSILALKCLLALDISYNEIDSCPRGLPSSLLALNLSNNLIPSCASFKIPNRLIELHLAHNYLSRSVNYINHDLSTYDKHAASY